MVTKEESGPYVQALEPLYKLFGLGVPKHPTGIGKDDAPILPTDVLCLLPVVGFCWAIGGFIAAHTISNEFGVPLQALNSAVLGISSQVVWLVVGIVYFG
jgi:hypothetical protein